MTLAQQNHELAMQHLQYNALQQKIAETRQAKHDIRHHATIMKNYIQKADYANLKAYLDGYIHNLPDDIPIVFCSNPAVNVLISYFAQQAKHHNITFHSQIYIPEETGIL